jgi:hypothetical protein
VISDGLLVAAVISALAAAAGVVLGLRQLRESAEANAAALRRADDIAQAAFEDSLTREYRALIADLPAEAFYVDGEVELSDELRRAFYRYFDLCNEQLYLGRRGRIRPDTRTQWEDGIKGNVTKLPAFQAAWAEIGFRVPGDFFEDLHGLVGTRSGLPGAG